MKKQLTAWVLGGTGAIGKELIKQLLKDDDYKEIYAVSRRKVKVEDAKLTNDVIDLESDFQLENRGGDVVFVAFGTTLKKAGSKAAQHQIDVEIPFRFLARLKEQGVKNCVLVSAMGVSEKSLFFYSRMKAELDSKVDELGFDHLVLVKPSVLDSVREEKRTGEEWSIKIGNFIGRSGLIDKYKPIKVEYVAQAMIISLDYMTVKVTTYNSAQLHDLSAIYRKEKGLN